MQKILIVGGGVAGLSLAHRMDVAGCDVTLVDKRNNVCTTIAAGMINPLVFRRMNKSWRVDEFLPAAKQFYKELEQQSGISFFYPIRIRRFFSSEQEKGFWLERQETKEFEDYMEIFSEHDNSINEKFSPFGSACVKNCFYVDALKFMKSIKKSSSIRFQKAQFDYESLDPLSGNYQGEVYDVVVFCEGFESTKNPWFTHLPIDPTKGEILTVQSDRLSKTESYNRKCFTLHIGEGKFKVGSTYDWHNDKAIPTDVGRNTILQHLSYLTDESVEVVEHVAGIRPTTKDRRPLMGRHDKFPKLAVFNGLGAKGFLLAPLLAQEMTNYLLKNTSLNQECVLSRMK